MKLLLTLAFLLGNIGFSQTSHSVWLGITNTSDDLFGDSSDGTLFYFLNHKLANTHRLQARFSMGINFDESEAKLGDVRLRHRYNFLKDKEWSIDSDFRLYLGLSENSQDNKGFVPLIQYTPSASYTVKPEKDFSISFIYKPMYGYHFNDRENFPDPKQPGFVINAVDHVLDNQFIAAFTYQKLSLELYFNFKMQWDSASRRVDDTFASFQDLYYNFNKTFTLMIGHSSGATIYDEKGIRQPLSFATKADQFYVFGIVNF